MTLRFRLTLALVGLATAGLAVFGTVTYSFFADSEYERLDDSLRSSMPLVARQLFEEAALDRFPGPGPGGGGDEDQDEPPNGFLVPPGTYGELRDVDGEVLSVVQLTDAADEPALPDDLVVGGEPITVGSVDGSTRWRVVANSEGIFADEFVVVVAIPTTSVTDSLDRLVLIEAVAAGGLLALLAGGSWLILRRGLHPLERMAATSRTITAGDLSPRVEPAGGTTEVGQLGLALNTMLDEIEVAFQEREATERRLRQFLSDASHELRTPLTSIQGFAELFRLRGEDGVDLPVILRRIEEESARMKELVEDLLLLARLDETAPAAREPVDLAVLAADACTDAAATDPSRPISLDAPEPVIVLGDRDHLRQAIANLVTNAVRHTAIGTAIDVAARVADGRAEVVVRDHGAGLDDETLDHVFDRFWQADPARAGTGAGLGLSIVAGIAEEHGGTARAANAPDGGALFGIDLPAASAPPRS